MPELKNTAAGLLSPEIPLLDSSTGNRVGLRVRATPFEMEIAKFPSDVRQDHKALMAARNVVNGQTYNLVMAWMRLRRSQFYWLQFGLSSEAAYLARFGLPDGPTLGNLAVLVELFDRPTFMVAGETALSFMLRLLQQHESDSEKCKAGYQEIFDQYCGSHSGFDLATFCKTVGKYVEVKYEQPAAKAAGLTLGDWRRSRGRQERGNGQVVEISSARPAVQPKRQQTACLACKSSQALVRAYAGYTRTLEKIISRRLGKQYLPKKPESLRDL